MSLEPDIPLRCKCRKHAVTSLRCSRCSVPICPDCSKIVPVGMVCSTCLHGKQIHIYQYGTQDVLRGLGASLLVAIAGGCLLATAHSFGLMLSIWGGLLQGYIVAEACLRVTNRKRGLVMEAIVGCSVVLGLVLGCLLISDYQGIPLEVYLASPYSYILLVIATVVGVGKVRNL